MTNLTDRIKPFVYTNPSDASLKRSVSAALRTLSKLSEVPKTFETADTLYIMPYCDRDARLVIKMWEQLFPKRPKRPLIHNGGKPRRRT